MGALLNAYNDFKNQNNPTNMLIQNAMTPSDSVVPKDYSKKYYENVSTPTPSYTPAGLQDMPGAVSNAYKSVGGGLKGVGLGALAGLGKVGEFISTKTGNQIMAGMSDNPYLAQGYLNNAGTAREEELGRNKMAFESNQEKMKNMGEDVRAKEQQLGQQKVAAMQIMAENQKALAQMSQEERFHAIDAKLKEQGMTLDSQKLAEAMDEFNAKQTQGANEIKFKNRSILTKGLGMVGIGNEITPSTVGNVPSLSKKAPSAGAKIGGYVFKGGDPADENNWELQ